MFGFFWMEIPFLSDGFSVTNIGFCFFPFVFSFLLLGIFDFFYLKLWRLPLSTCMFPFYNLSIFLALAPNVRHMWLKITNIFWYPAWGKLIFLSIVSTDSSLVGAMFPVSHSVATSCRVLPESSFNSRIICIFRLVKVFVLKMWNKE